MRDLFAVTPFVLIPILIQQTALHASEPHHEPHLAEALATTEYYADTERYLSASSFRLRGD